MMATLRAYIKKHEGCSLTPYQCTAGQTTIGYGHNLTANGISQPIAEDLFEEDFGHALLYASAFWPGAQDDEPNRFAAIVDMAFNLGPTRLNCFEHLRAALERADYPAAAAAIRASRYAKQLPQRAHRNAQIILTGQSPETYL
jgi:lysozyme